MCRLIHSLYKLHHCSVEMACTFHLHVSLGAVSPWHSVSYILPEPHLGRIWATSGSRPGRLSGRATAEDYGGILFYFAALILTRLSRVRGEGGTETGGERRGDGGREGGRQVERGREMEEELH